MKRRQFLKQFAGVTAAYGLSGFTGMRFAHAANEGKVLVLVFLRGGWDGLSVTVPFGDDDYYRNRPTLAVNAPGQENGALNLDGFFGLHPAMTELYRMYQTGSVALMPTVLHDAGNTSHFAAQDIIESGTTPATPKGWLTRLLNQDGHSAAERALSLDRTPPYSLAGATPQAPTFPNLDNLDLALNAQDQTAISKVFDTAYGWEGPETNPNRVTLQQLGSSLTAELTELKGIAASSIPSVEMYPDSQFGTQLRQAAAVIKSRRDLNFLTIDYGGWDTHRHQGPHYESGLMWSMLADFSRSIEAFFDDLGTDASNVLLLTSTEFGRTARENASAGTDHGHASTWVAVSPSLRGGIYMGGHLWPGLSETQLADGRALKHTVDFRSVYSEVAGKFLATSNTSTLFSDFVPSDIGFLG
ncbi:DUF1501 domain-containing protein [Nitrogeniibacter aestuarii]|uniref:DUF1501 domain-containing protein n=1 Tax=Nitrogeniibacter aestuarii TaxID=2815343 RepID=UPI001D11DE02|nr:DUF1501 domain-containing protein [Nitrogeniibacter aestuarii]